MIDFSATGINYSISAQYCVHKENLRYTLGTTDPTKNLLSNKWNVHVNCTKWSPQFYREMCIALMADALSAVRLSRKTSQIRSYLSDVLTLHRQRQAQEDLTAANPSTVGIKM